MRDQYGTEAVTLLGGEPFVHRDLTQVVRHAKEEPGLRVEICTNGYRIERRLTEIAPYLDLLRVSQEGVGSTNDGIRKQGSYQSALNGFGLARDLGVPTGATMTVTSRNIAEVLPLGRALAQLGVRQLKLHHLRPVGNAADHPELLVTSPPILLLQEAQDGWEDRIGPVPAARRCLGVVEVQQRGGLAHRCFVGSFDLQEGGEVGRRRRTRTSGLGPGDSGGGRSTGRSSTAVRSRASRVRFFGQPSARTSLLPPSPELPCSILLPRASTSEVGVLGERRGFPVTAGRYDFEPTLLPTLDALQLVQLGDQFLLRPCLGGGGTHGVGNRSGALPDGGRFHEQDHETLGAPPPRSTPIGRNVQFRPRVAARSGHPGKRLKRTQLIRGNPQ